MTQEKAQFRQVNTNNCLTCKNLIKDYQNYNSDYTLTDYYSTVYRCRIVENVLYGAQSLIHQDMSKFVCDFWEAK